MNSQQNINLEQIAQGLTTQNEKDTQKILDEYEDFLQKNVTQRIFEEGLLKAALKNQDTKAESTHKGNLERLSEEFSEYSQAAEEKLEKIRDVTEQELRLVFLGRGEDTKLH